MRVDSSDHIIELCHQQAKANEVYFIARIQSRKDLTITINNGRTEDISTGVLEGIGIQVFNQKGFMGFAAADQLNLEVTEELMKKAVFLAKQAEAFRGESNQEILKVPPLHKRLEIRQEIPSDSMPISEIEERLRNLNQEVAVFDCRLAVRTLLRITDEEWRIARSDGADVIFNTPRSFVYHMITAKSGSRTTTTYVNLPGTDLRVIIDPHFLNILKERVKKAAQLSLDLLTAEDLPAGNYKLVIDYALAKGLAHEAFGHAAETDAIESSILGENGRMKTGMIVANPKLSIIDGPIEGDYAYQPISAVGIERQTVKIVDHGVLKAGLADIFSAARAGVGYTGAERVENFYHLPIARMSNIRIEIDDPIPIDLPFEKIKPDDLYRILITNGLAEPNEKVLYLTGFQGGQVNPAFGDFVFHCSGIYQLGERPVLYKPAIFSGKILTVLRSVTAALGPLQIDAMGTCGKMGQGVPSCGGSHLFLVIDANPEIMIGGK
jgi:TldD protein